MRLCTICARGGSLGVKNKNLQEINGISLIGISITQAKRSNLFSHVAVSSDCPNILSEAERFGADHLIKRPDDLATSTAGKIPTIQHAVKWMQEKLNITFETLVDLDVTSPLRLVRDIVEAVELKEINREVKNVITGTPARRSPYFNLVESDLEGWVHLSKQTKTAGVIRRQDSPKCYDMNASIYVWDNQSLFESQYLSFSQTKILVMPEERSIDVDSELDLDFVRFIAQKHNRFREVW